MDKINLKDFTLEELNELERRIGEERYSLLKCEKSIKFIELKTKYEGQWLIANDCDMVYVKEISDSYLGNVTVLRFVDWGDEFYVALDFMSLPELDEYVFLDADEVFTRLNSFMESLLKFIREETK